MRDILDSRYATTNDVTHTHIYIEFIYRVYRFRPCILNSYDTLWLRNAIFLRLSIESTITLQLVNRGAMRLRCSNLMVWTGYYGLQRPIHRGRKAFRRIVANNRGWVTTKSAPLLSATRLPLVRLETCAPHYRRIRLRMRGCRAPAALAPTGAAGFHFGHGSRSQRHFFAIVCGRTTRFAKPTGALYKSLHRGHESDRFFFYIGSFRWNTRREKAARVNRILPRFSRARKGAVHRFKRRRGTRIESGINCFLCTAKEAS